MNVIIVRMGAMLSCPMRVKRIETGVYDGKVEPQCAQALRLKPYQMKLHFKSEIVWLTLILPLYGESLIFGQNPFNAALQAMV